MVNTENKYKKPVKGSYNNQRYRNTKPVEYRSFLRFLFSLSGKMSRDLFVGLRMVIFLTLIIITFGFSFITTTNKIVISLMTSINLVGIWIFIATGYKRAHALGISGFYSIIGTMFAKPFFEFNKQDNDYINENIKTPLKKLRKFGNFVNRNLWTKLGYLFVSYLITFGFMLLNSKTYTGKNIIDLLMFVGILAAINVAQLLLVKLKYFRHFYMQIVKVCVFCLYHLMIVAMIVLSMQNACLKICVDLYNSYEAKQEALQKQEQHRIQKSKAVKNNNKK